MKFAKLTAALRNALRKKRYSILRIKEETDEINRQFKEYHVEVEIISCGWSRHDFLRIRRTKSKSFDLFEGFVQKKTNSLNEVEFSPNSAEIIFNILESW